MRRVNGQPAFRRSCKGEEVVGAAGAIRRDAFEPSVYGGGVRLRQREQHRLACLHQGWAAVAIKGTVREFLLVLGADLADQQVLSLKLHTRS